jgi:hypothetical protein
VASSLRLYSSLYQDGAGVGLRFTPANGQRREEKLETSMKEYSTCLVASVLFVVTISLPVAAQQDNAEGTTVEKVKIKVAKLGVGEKAKATVILKDGTKTKGYIAQAGSADFVLRDRKTDSPTTIRYSDVSKVESNKGHSTARNIAIGVGIGAGAFLAIILITIAHLD